MSRIRKSASALLSILFLVTSSNSGVSAPSFADESGLESQPIFSNDASKSAVDRLSKSIEALARQRLSAYTISRYANAPKPTLDRFAENFDMVAATDPSAEMHPSYLVALEKQIVAAPSIKEDGALFGAYAHLLLTLRNENADVANLLKSRETELKSSLRDATVGKISPKTDDERSEAFRVFAQLKYDPWSSTDLSRMRQTIENRKIWPDTRYFKAYAFARADLGKTSGEISLTRSVPHTKQQWSLSCEANSMRDVVNYYRLGNGESAASEGQFVFLLPSNPELPKYQNGVRIWGDPAKAFVGKIDGRQSSNPQKLTGYGIYADGVLPYLRRELKSYGLRAEKNTFDADTIRDSIATGNPVFFWYVVGSDPALGAGHLEWTTPEGRSVTGYVGEHVGVIVGAKIGNDGEITEVSYYEGRSSSLQKESFDSLSRKAKWFNEAIYVSSIEKPAEKAAEAASDAVKKIRKKNVKSAVATQDQTTVRKKNMKNARPS